jgi:hypothetical protein
VVIRNKHPKEPIHTVEFTDPITLFTRLETTSTKTCDETKPDQNGKETKKKPNGIPTPSFMDFFGDEFLSENRMDEAYQPLNNATEIQPSDINAIGSTNNTKGQDGPEDSLPESIYWPRKIIPLTPTMIRIILEESEQKFDGIIDSIRKYAWFKVNEFKKKESRGHVAICLI